MARILMLARHFPPIGGAGVHRTLGSVRHLPGHGYEPVVVTGAAERHGRWEPRDEQLLELVPPDVRVYRAPPAPVRQPSPLERVRGAPPPWVRAWVRASERLAVEAGRGADVIYASCLPYETAFAAARAAHALGLPWVADLEDAWALDEMRIAPSRLHRAQDFRRMRRALATASVIVTAAPEAATRLRQAMPELAARITITGIPIGFDPGDVAAARPPTPDGIFRIVHTGSLHTDLGERLRRTRTRRRLLGGTVPGLDVLTRSHVFLTRALAGLIAADPGLAARIELHLAGELTAEDRAAIAGNAFVRTHGLLSHRETLALLRSADLLFLPMHDLPPGVRASLIPYKTYDYLAAGRPILAAVPDGDVRDMLTPLPQATVVRPGDVGAMADAVRARMAAAQAGPEPDAPPPAVYARDRCVAMIADVLTTARRTSRSAR
jgi:hypothetical protein